jgi:mono/diheme cytochrome c family protein
MKQRFLSLFFLIITGLVFYTSCHKEGTGISAVSKHNLSNSHYNGQNCITCHVKNGKGAGAGWFVVAGSVYKPDQITMNQNPTIHLYTQANGGGKEVATIEADAFGNFYTTEAVDFAGGLYPAVESASGGIQYMNQVTRTGACNGCHATSSPGKIFCN